MKTNRIAEILSLALFMTIALLGVCWGPPGPPSVPVGNGETIALTTIGIAVYGYWKMRK